MVTIKRIKLLYLDEFGQEIPPELSTHIRLSIFFDNKMDNHHIQIDSNCDRNTIINALIGLAKRIKGEK